MGFFRFRRRLEIFPGVHLNVGKTGLSMSAGVPGAQVTLGHTGLRATAGIPGTGLSYTSHDPDTRVGSSYGEMLGLNGVREDAAAATKGIDWKEYALAISELLPDEPEELRMYLDLKGQTCGPYSFTQTIVMLANETIPRDTLFCLNGSPDWVSLASLDIEDILREYRAVMDLK